MSDLKLLEEGWRPVLIEEPMDNIQHRFGGTCDAIFYLPAKPGQTDRFLITDLTYSASVNPFATNTEPSASFRRVFGMSAAFSDTLFHRHGLQLNLYAFLLRSGIDSIIRSRYQHPSPDDKQYDLQLELIVAHEDVELQIWQYPVKTAIVRDLLDSWHTFKGHSELLRRDDVSRDFKQRLSKTADPSSTVLGALLTTVKRGKKLIPNQDTLTADEAMAYNCNWEVFISHYPSVSKFVVEVSGMHNAKCVAAARAFRIHQPVSPALVS
jgi:hypothetical protein